MMLENIWKVSINLKQMLKLTKNWLKQQKTSSEKETQSRHLHLDFIMVR